MYSHREAFKVASGRIEQNTLHSRITRKPPSWTISFSSSLASRIFSKDDRIERSESTIVKWMMSLPGFIKWTVATKTHYLMTFVLDARCTSVSSFDSVFIHLCLLFYFCSSTFRVGLTCRWPSYTAVGNNILFYYIALIMLANHAHPPSPLFGVVTFFHQAPLCC